MKRKWTLITTSLIIVVTVLITTSSPAAYAAVFTPGNLVVYRVGDGVGSLVNTGNPVFLDEYTTAGTLVQSIAMPTTASGSNRQLIASGTAPSEGFLTLSTDGQYLLLTGYARDLGGTANIVTTTASTVPRTIGRVDASGNIDTSTALTDFASGSNPRSAASMNGTVIWATGGAGGVRYTTLGSTTSTSLVSGFTNGRQVKIGRGQLYVSSGSTPNIGVNAVGTGTPTTAGQILTLLSGLPATLTSPYSYYLADLDVGVDGYDTLYVADDAAAALTKFSLVAGSWISNGSIGVNADDYRGLVGIRSGATVTLFATRQGGQGPTGGGELVSLVDSNGYNGAFTATPTILATASLNTAFRGVAFTPGTSPTVVQVINLSANATDSTLVIPLTALGLMGLMGAWFMLHRRSRAA